jgi:3',5'-cyclic AMP phosphodiesterase CpdA
MQVGQHPPPTHVLAHVSDTHFLAGRRPLYDQVDTDRWLVRAMRRLESYAPRLDALVFTGDIADLGEAAAYRRVREIVEPTAALLGAELVWVMGNHDERSAFRTELLGAAPSTGPVDRVVDLGGLRVVTIDTSVPGFHHGELSDEQLDWLATVLATSSPHGTLLAMHHPPVPTPMPVMQVLELLDQHRLAEVVRGSDVRAVLGGHLHYNTTGMFAGVPVSVAASTCYTVDTIAPVQRHAGWDGAQTINLVYVLADQVVHTVAPLGTYDPIEADPAGLAGLVAQLDAEQRIERISRHDAW